MARWVYYSNTLFSCVFFFIRKFFFFVKITFLEKGLPYKYRDVTDLSTASLEDIQYNIDLSNKKKALTDFYSLQDF